MEFTLKCSDGERSNGSAFTAHDLTQLLSELDYFIKGCGFCPKGELDFVQEPIEEFVFIRGEKHKVITDEYGNNTVESVD